jgi:predicted enzyme related to lactoylglutathione lyase
VGVERPAIQPDLRSIANDGVTLRAAAADGAAIIIEPFDGSFGWVFAIADPDGCRIAMGEKDQPPFWPCRRG